MTNKHETYLLFHIFNKLGTLFFKFNLQKIFNKNHFKKRENVHSFFFFFGDPVTLCVLQKWCIEKLEKMKSLSFDTR